jgi:hypothetical protein
MAPPVVAKPSASTAAAVSIVFRIEFLLVIQMP